MRALTLFLALVVLPHTTMAQRVSIATGSLTLPSGFVVRALRGTDSHPGLILRADSSLVIDYDIGAMAGTRVTPRNRGDYVWIIEHAVGGHRAYTGLSTRDGRRRISATILGDGREAWILPANFSADVRDERDVAEFMLIVVSYEGRRQP